MKLPLRSLSRLHPRIHTSQAAKCSISTHTIDFLRFITTFYHIFGILSRNKATKEKKKCEKKMSSSHIKCNLSGVFNFCTIDVNDIPNVLFLTLYNQIFINLIGKIA
jgi:hypothetical protein